ncbi:MAG: class I SAM-dependent methyltransferase [Alphaproteobacteria bacterium]|nr:class I SAM-dependent methyltransferase [Alphaproteobacteria bacterium SS10]
MTTLVFPSSTPESHRYLQEAVNRGEPVVAASSVKASLDIDGLTDHALPLINQDGFDEALIALVKANGVKRVFSPSAVVYVHLRKLIERENLPLQFVQLPPIYQEMERQTDEAAAARLDIEYASQFLNGGDFLTAPQLQALLRAAFGIYGESYRHKLVALAACAFTAPAGDYVEIGCLYGRSCSVIVQALKMAGRSDAVLAIDAWASDVAHQTSLSDDLADEWLSRDLTPIADAFDANLMPLATRGQFNRLRLPSAEARPQYGPKAVISTDAFGPTQYTGQIGFLHIDANHDYEAVKADRDLWCPLVKPGGWIVFDDYNWRHGAGPGQAADEFCAARQDDIERCVFLDGALFIKLAA